jgi:8-oxo-dGTP diphosphatase
MSAPMITVTAAVLTDDELVFAARRGPGKHLEGYWEFPGGKLEKGETPEQCLSRELEEEFGIQVEVGSFIGESIYDYGHKTIRLIAYQVILLAGEFELRDHDQVMWLPKNELSRLKWAPADVPLLAMID